MSNKIEIIAGVLSVIGIATAIYLVQLRIDSRVPVIEQVAQAPQSGIVIVDKNKDSTNPNMTQVENNSMNNQINLSRMIVEDIKIGKGKEVEIGNTVLVHYAGTLQDGTPFDNSRQRGAPFSFNVGAGQVIAGWDEGLIGMKEGGERILVIPPDKAYGDAGIGPIPGGATLVFTIELLEVK
jgi:FKBP-type peptidyl-prolyl cis-trans isomerase